MYQGVFLLKDPCDSHSLLGNLHLVLAPAEAFRKKGISDFELTTFKRKDIKQSMKLPFSSMGECDGSERRLPETTVLTIISAGWCKYQKNGKTFRLYLGECTNRPSCVFTGSGSCLMCGRSSLSRQHLWQGCLFHLLKCGPAYGFFRCYLKAEAI